MKDDDRPWMATATRIGTNDRIEVLGATKADVDLQLYGASYGAARDTVVYFRVGKRMNTQEGN